MAAASAEHIARRVSGLVRWWVGGYWEGCRVNNIEVGCMVEIIRPSKCNCCTYLGERFIVSEVRMSRGQLECHTCGKLTEIEMIAIDSAVGLCCELYRLKRIDPPAIPESVETENEVTA